MKLDVVFSPLGLLPGQATGRTIFVIDILATRAVTPTDGATTPATEG